MTVDDIEFDLLKFILDNWLVVCLLMLMLCMYLQSEKQVDSCIDFYEDKLNNNSFLEKQIDSNDQRLLETPKGLYTNFIIYPLEEDNSNETT